MRGSTSPAFAAVFVVLAAASCPSGLAAPGDIDRSFDPGSGVNGEVAALAVPPDGKILIGGRFTTVDGYVRRGVARLNADGSGDGGFDPGSGANGEVKALALQPDGKVLIGGEFSVMDGAARPGLARLNPDGSLDAGFLPDLRVVSNPSIRAVVVQPDGKVLVGGFFSAGEGSGLSSGIARLNPDGSLDSNFNPVEPWPDSANHSFEVHAIALQADGKVLVAGMYTFCQDNGGDPEFGGGGISCDNEQFLIRMDPDGGRDAAFILAAGPVTGIGSIAIQRDGGILVGGLFRVPGGALRSGIVRIHANGSIDTGFEASLNGEVTAIIVQPDGKVMVGTEVATVTQGTSGDGIVRLNADGSRDASFDLSDPPSSSVRALALQPDGKVMVGGSFTMMGGDVCPRLARIDSHGGRDPGFSPGTAGVDYSIAGDGHVSSIVRQPDGRVLIGGRFDIVGGSRRPALARLDRDGRLDPGFEARLEVDENLNYGNPEVNAMVLDPDGKVLIGGQFTKVGGTGRNRIARLNPDGSLDDGFNPATGIEGGDYPTVLSMALQPGGKVLIGGQFETVAGVSRRGFARLSSEGVLDGGFAPSLEPGSSVHALAVQPDGKILAGGRVSTLYYDPGSASWLGSIHGFLARFNENGTRDLVRGDGIIEGTVVLAVVAQRDGKILIGGHFSSVLGAERVGLARLTADGSLDPTFVPATRGAGSSVHAIAVQPDGAIVIAGWFAVGNRSPSGAVARLLPDGSLDSRFGPGLVPTDRFVGALALLPDGNVLAGGAFGEMDGLPRTHVARLFGAFPELHMSIVGPAAVLTWAAAYGEYQLQESRTLATGSWLNVAQPAGFVDGSRFISIPTDRGARFFRLVPSRP